VDGLRIRTRIWKAGGLKQEGFRLGKEIASNVPRAPELGHPERSSIRLLLSLTSMLAWNEKEILGLPL
jgi:hypothetical protein